MNAVQDIRRMIGETQTEFAHAIKVSQGNVSFYENGSTVLPEVAMRIIAHARDYGYALTLDHVYGLKQLPKRPNLVA